MRKGFSTKHYRARRERATKSSPRKNDLLISLTKKQESALYKAYRIGFLFMLAVLWVETLTTLFWGDVISQTFMLDLAMWGGLFLVLTYGTLTIHQRSFRRFLKTYGQWIGYPILVIAVGLTAFAIWVGVSYTAWIDFFEGAGRILIVSVGLLALGIAVLFRHRSFIAGVK